MYNDENDYELLYLVKEENEDAKNIFYEKYRPLIEMKAKKYYSMSKNKGFELNDLIQEGMIGLSSAIHDYDEEKDAKFYTFAIICIERQMTSFIRNVNRQKHQALNNSIPIDETYTKTGRSLMEILNDTSAKDPEESFILIEEQEEIKNKMSKYLSNKERDVFDLRLEGFSYQEIALLLNMSPKAVDGAISRIKQKLSNVKKNK